MGLLKDAIVIFKAIELKNTRIKSMREFSELIGAHYKKQLMSQVYLVVYIYFPTNF